MGAESWAPTPQHRRKPRALPEDCIKPVADGTQSRPVWWDCDPSSSTKPLPEWPPERWKCPYHGGCRHRTPRASSPVMDCPVPCPWARREVVEWCDKVNRRLRDSTGRTEHAMEQSSRATEVLWAPLRQWMGQVHMGLHDLQMWERTWDGNVQHRVHELYLESCSDASARWRSPPSAEPPRPISGACSGCMPVGREGEPADSTP